MPNILYSIQRFKLLVVNHCESKKLFSLTPAAVSGCANSKLYHITGAVTTIVSLSKGISF
jgi:hypothetical protein